jgi:dolichyl-phosphate-mannose--protein O-mannosyl transferase
MHNSIFLHSQLSRTIRAMPAKHSSSKLKNSVWIYFGFVLLTSFFTYFYRYNQPQAVFWDEPYHIASAEKYLNGVYFMEQHPPLGKLLIALGEKIVNANKNDSQFINTDYATGIEPSFSFAGYRLFPTLLAWLTAPVLFFIFFYFTKNPVLSALLSFLYIFDNAEIVHSRGAMVDAPLTFFGMLISLLFIHLQGQRHQKDLWKFGILATLFGVVFGLIMTTKVVGLIFILFAPAILWRLFPDGQKMVMFIGLSLLGFIVSASAVNFANYWGEVVSSQSKNQTVAWDFLKFITSRDSLDKYYVKHKQPSSRRDLIELQVQDPEIGVFANANLTAKSFYKPNQEKMDAIFAEVINNVQLKGLSSSEALSQAESQAQALVRGSQ